jgi:hypothetical protein
LANLYDAFGGRVAWYTIAAYASGSASVVISQRTLDMSTVYSRSIMVLSAMPWGYPR